MYYEICGAGDSAVLVLYVGTDVSEWTELSHYPEFGDQTARNCIGPEADLATSRVIWPRQAS
jgi:hypothetical protein